MSGRSALAVISLSPLESGYATSAVFRERQMVPHRLFRQQGEAKRRAVKQQSTYPTGFPLNCLRYGVPAGELRDSAAEAPTGCKGRNLCELQSSTSSGRPGSVRVEHFCVAKAFAPNAAHFEESRPPTPRAARGPSLPRVAFQARCRTSRPPRGSPKFPVPTGRSSWAASPQPNLCGLGVQAWRFTFAPPRGRTLRNV
jgi:hypothetical protein